MERILDTEVLMGIYAEPSSPNIKKLQKEQIQTDWAVANGHRWEEYKCSLCPPIYHLKTI